jgi:CheY-like chemotaxis protein
VAAGAVTATSVSTSKRRFCRRRRHDSPTPAVVVPSAVQAAPMSTQSSAVTCLSSRRRCRHPAAALDASDRPRGGETILVVEDDPLVRDFVVAQLRDLGYRVIAAVDGPQALAVLDSDASIDLPFTDVVMPGGMSGRQLAERALQRRPGLKTLYSSGYTENSIVHQGKLDRGVYFLSKPFRCQDLATKVGEVLDAAG